MKPLQSFLCSGGNALWVDISQFPTPFKEEAHKHSALGGGVQLTFQADTGLVEEGWLLLRIQLGE